MAKVPQQRKRPNRWPQGRPKPRQATQPVRVATEQRRDSGRATQALHVGDLVMGRNCIEELLKHSPGRVKQVYLVLSAEDSARVDERLRRLLEQLRSLRIPFAQRTRRELDELVASDSHQGVVARVSPRAFVQPEDLLELAKSTRLFRVLALDGIVDPQNFGALLRAAECFGVDGVIWSRNRGAPLGPVVAKVSVGASEIVPLCPVPNLHRLLEQLKAQGAWLVGAVLADDAVSLDSFDFPAKCVLVVGSEAQGIQQLIEKSLDFKVAIPMAGALSSLNVSQASAVMLGELAKQHRRQEG